MLANPINYLVVKKGAMFRRNFMTKVRINWTAHQLVKIQLITSSYIVSRFPIAKERPPTLDVIKNFCVAVVSVLFIYA